MRIATYNLFEGAQDTYALLKEFVEQQDLDILCIQEANEWQDGDPSRLDDFSASTGLDSYVFGNSPRTRFKLATFSRLPILSSVVHTEGYWHCAVQTVIDTGSEPLDLWNVHLNPQDEDKRLEEARRIAADLAVGDFNGLSRSDRYPNLLEKLQVQGIEKFGATALRYEVTDYLTKAGLVDLGAELGSNTYTVPTQANQDMFHAARMRLDYMFALPRIAALARSLVVIKNSLTDQISDHYPVVLVLK